MNAVTETVKAAVATAPLADLTLVKNLPDEGKELACKVADDAYDAYYDAEEGIFALEEKVAAKKEKSVGWGIMQIAQLATRLSIRDVGGERMPDMRVAGPLFRALCEVGERHVRAKHAENGIEPAMSELIPAWSSYKSKIGAGLDQGLDPTATVKIGGAPVYPTASKFISEATALNKGANERETDKQESTPKVSQLELVKSGYGPELSAAISVLFQGFERLNMRGQIAAAQIVATAAGSVQDLHKNPDFLKVAQATTGDPVADQAAADKLREERKAANEKLPGKPIEAPPAAASAGKGNRNRKR